MKINKWVIVVIAIAIACLHHHTYNRHIDFISKKRISSPVINNEIPPAFDLLPDLAMWYIITN